MTHLSYAKVPKPVEYRLGELVQGLSVIRDSLQLVQSGHAHQVLPMAGQLRALLTDRSTKPLLYAVAESLGAELRVWTEGGLRGKRGPDQESPLLFGMQGVHLTASQQMSTQVEVPLADALDEVVLHAQGTNYSARDVIEFLANRAGGVHYDQYLPATLGSVMSTIQVGGLPAPMTAVVQFGQAALDLGTVMLRGLTEVDFDLVLAIRTLRPEGPAFLFDARCPQPEMRYYGQVSPNYALTFGVLGVGGRFAASAQNVSDWSRPHHVRFMHRLRDDLTSNLCIEVDGELRLDVSPGQLILATAGPEAYEIRFNGSFDEPHASCEWALGEFGMSSPPRTAYERAEALLSHAAIAREKTTYKCLGRDDHLLKALASSDLAGQSNEQDLHDWLSAGEAS